MRAIVSALASVLLAAFAGAAVADVDKSGAEFRINSYTTGYQSNPHVAATDTGKFVVVWSGRELAGGFTSDVWARRVGAGSAAEGDEFLVNTFTAGSQRSADVASDANGNFLVVWSSPGQDGNLDSVIAQRFDAAGAKLGSEFRVNTFTMGNQSRPSVAGWPDGRFIVAWESDGPDGDEEGIFGQRYSAAGAPLGTEFQINTYTADRQLIAEVATLANGGFVVAWLSVGQDDTRTSGGSGTFAQRFAADGAKAGTEFQVNTYTTGFQESVAIAPRSDGGFTMVWQDFQQDPSGQAIFAQRYAAGGNRLGGEFQVDSLPTGEQFRPRAIGTADSGFLAMWQDSIHDGSERGLFGRCFDASGQPVGTEFQINTYTTGNQTVPEVAAHPDGQMLIAWQSPVGADFGDVFAQRFNGEGSPPPVACGDPAFTYPAARLITAADALVVLRAAVGVVPCLACICDVDGSGSVSASDALITLRIAVGQQIPLQCPAC